MDSEKYKIVVDILATTEKFKAALDELEARMKKTAEGVEAQQRRMVEATNREVRQANAEMRKNMEAQKKAMKSRAGGIGKIAVSAFASKIASVASIGLAISAVDKVIGVITNRIKNGGEEAGIGLGFQILESLQDTMRNVPIFGSMMDLVGAGFGANDFESQQSDRAKAQVEVAKRTRQQIKHQERLQAIIDHENAEREASVRLMHELADATRAAVAEASAGAMMIVNQRVEAEDNLRNARAKNIRIGMQGDEEGLRNFNRQLELYELSLSFERRIEEARRDNRNLLADELTEHHNKLRALTEESHALEDQMRLMDQMSAAIAEQTAAENELSEARSQALGKAAGAVTSFNTAGGSFTTAAQVGAMNEAKLLNRISKKSQELLAEIAKNTAGGGDTEVDLA